MTHYAKRPRDFRFMSWITYTNAQLLRAMRVIRVMRVSEQEPDTDTPEAKK